MQTEISAPQKKHRDHGWTLTFIIIAITIVAAVFYTGGVVPKVEKTYFLQDTEGVPIQKENYASGSALLIDTLTFNTITPIPSNAPPPGAQPISPTIPASTPPVTSGPTTCGSHQLIVNGCQCPYAVAPGIIPSLTEREIVCPGPECEPARAACARCLEGGTPDGIRCEVPFRGYTIPVNCTRNFVENSKPGSHPFCFGKPVIYLYPEKPTYISVKLHIPGEIYISDPHYPKEGWQNVLAYPDGTLYYQNKKYRELYYESAVDNVKAPENGIIVPKKDIKKEIIRVTTQLGLIKHEQDEFLEYWLPKIAEIDKPYILVSLIDPVEKERVDGIEYSVEPDTRIEFLVYFKGVIKPYTLPPFKLPETIPQRIGFTAVEWGGTIDEN